MMGFRISPGHASAPPSTWRPGDPQASAATLAGAAALAFGLALLFVHLARLPLLSAVGLSAGLTLAAVVDARLRLIPNLASLLIAGLAFFPGLTEGWTDRLAFALLLGGGLWAVQALHRHLRGEDGVGLGDIKLIVALALWLWPLTAAVALAVTVAMAVVYSWTNRGTGVPLAVVIAPVFAAAVILQRIGWAP
jgi:leader peptidase (prepilin peptidase)/N-methyltransferase